MKLEFICEYGPAGDQCFGYNVKIEAPCTVKEFIEEVLRQRTDEWGTFEIGKAENMKYLDAAREVRKGRKTERGNTTGDRRKADQGGKSKRRMDTNGLFHRGIEEPPAGGVPAGGLLCTNYI